jgi:hypothetical protein
MHAHVLTGPKLHVLLMELLQYYLTAASTSTATAVSTGLAANQERVVVLESGIYPLWALLEAVFFVLKGTIPYHCVDVPIVGMIRLKFVISV